MKVNAFYIFILLLFFVSCTETKKQAMTPWGTSIGEDSIPASSSFGMSDIQNNGELIMLTLSGPESYYDYHGHGMGLQYLLCEKFAEKIGVSASQLSRIVSGETRTVSSDILIGVAKEFKVSTDYILGLSTVSVRKSYDISELGLSEGAVRGLVTGAVDVQILNRLLEHRNFPKLIDLIRIYFQDTAAKGIMARNQLIEMATASLSDLMKEHPEHRAEAKQDLQFLNAQKLGEHEAEIEKIKNVFLAILRDIKKDIDNGEQPGETVTAAMFQAMRDTMAEQKQNPLSIDDVTAMIAGQIGQLAPMDKETADLFQQLAKKMIEQAGK